MWGLTPSWILRKFAQDRAQLWWAAAAAKNAVQRAKDKQVVEDITAIDK